LAACRERWTRIDVVAAKAGTYTAKSLGLDNAGRRPRANMIACGYGSGSALAICGAMRRSGSLGRDDIAYKVLAMMLLKPASLLYLPRQ
jgi:hypothetical protein